MDEAEGEESASLSASAPYLGLVGMQIDDEPYTPSPSSAFITATPGILEAPLHDEEIPAEQGGIDYDLSGLTPERFDHDAAKARLKQYKKEAEERKRKKMLAQQREAERLNAEMAREREKMSVIQTARETEAKQKAQERFERQRQEREERARAREELKHANRSPVRTGMPLYKRREMEMERIKQQEENLRRQKLRQHQEHFKQIDFIALEREAREAKRQQQYDDFGSSRPTRINPREKINLPPVNSQYYHGNAMNRVREQHLSQRNKVNQAREDALRRRQAAVKYSRLVSELVPTNSKPRRPVRREPSRFGAMASPTRRVGSDRGKNGRLTMHGGGSSSAPATFNEQEVKELSTRATALNRQARQLEEELDASDVEMDFEETYRSKATLMTTYIDAIRTKVELLEAVRAG
mmetsp:Transcript_28163/g.76939  ORF Transcript_28163/g.76939 Transcript_28163/m.76939 type:complete len:410 (-) Transcript_28163:334-1563(-)|eukprot:scaffold217980_cov30-Tisochrysis_lutea.AAC.1